LTAAAENIVVPTTKVPEAFCARIEEHNRSCWIAAALSLWCAGLAWAVASGLYATGVLLFVAIRSVDTFELPQWFYPAAICGIIGLFFCAAVDRRLGRFKPFPDRSIIGWHLIADVLLLPARASLMVWDYLDARILLSLAEREEAWQLMRRISKMKRADSSLLASDFPDPARLAKMLMALQFAGLIDLHRGEEDWYYRVRSDQERAVGSLVTEFERSGDELRL
jgi:hypothetical protein